ncbi:MAG: hypothetical protein ACSHX7_06715 [Luteolibacter sp.]
MNQITPPNMVLFPGTPSCATTENEIAPKFLTTVVVAECRKSCEELAGTIDVSDVPEHDTINDCLAACDEYSVAAARKSKHTMRYAIWCSDRCEELLSQCHKINTPAARSTAKWLKAVTKQMNREVISWKQVKRTTNQEVTWGSVKEVIPFDPFRSSARKQSF